MGFIDFIDRYLYRSPLLVSLFLGFALFTIIWKSWSRVVLIGVRKPAIKIGYSVSLTFLDLILATAFVLLLLNFEGLLALL
jgi:divalent metal cation (Fe/Co/Zn/Cd) transporter